MTRLLISFLIVGTLNHYLLGTSVGQYTRTDLENLIEAMISARESISTFDFACEVQIFESYQNKELRLVNRTQDDNVFWAWWSEDGQHELTTLFDGKSAQNRVYGPTRRENVTLWHEDVNALDMHDFCLDPRKIGLVNGFRYGTEPLRKFFHPSRIKSVENLSFEEVEDSEIAGLIDVSIPWDELTTTIVRIDPITLRVYRIRQVPGYRGEDYMQIDSQYDDDLSSIIPSRVVAEVVDKDETTSRTVIKVTKIDTNPKFDDQSFGLAALELKVGQGVSVPANKATEFWNGQALQKERIANRIIREVKAEEAKGGVSNTAIVLFLISGMAATAIGVRAWLLRS